ncbi:hypothetical protein [Butyrivibrio sp.]|uniref:hypothetical protein n=1 Tax=Butyrivibrio sp. TaxID=28121 RepID=UPI0025BFDF38|nr:hypothetical protein [Butyrivibrio sp.]
MSNTQKSQSHKKVIITLSICMGMLIIFQLIGWYLQRQSYSSDILDSPGGLGEITVEKPVIYLYPETSQDVTVSLNIDGEFLALDPEFNIPNGWKVTATPDGMITYNDKQYPYLFWEADLSFNADMYSGFCIKGSETKAFLLNTLPELGLNEQEIAGYIEYWLPQMENNAYNLISFQGQNYTDAAELIIDPAPDTIIRVCMVYVPCDHYIKISPQRLTAAPKRTGFTVVEWGGAKLDDIYQIETDIIK